MRSIKAGPRDLPRFALAECIRERVGTPRSNIAFRHPAGSRSMSRSSLLGLPARIRERTRLVLQIVPLVDLSDRQHITGALDLCPREPSRQSRRLSSPDQRLALDPGWRLQIARDQLLWPFVAPTCRPALPECFREYLDSDEYQRDSHGDAGKYLCGCWPIPRALVSFLCSNRLETLDSSESPNGNNGSNSDLSTRGPECPLSAR